MKTLVLLDFDGSVYKGDSMRDFARFMNPGKYIFSLFIVMIPYGLSLLKLLDRDRVKLLFLKLNFRGKGREELFEAGRKFYEKARRNCYSKASAWIADQKDADLYLVSASCRPWLEPFARAWKMGLICTELTYDESGNCTGNWKGKNLRGKAKVEAVRERIDLTQYTEIWAFGNERSDLALKEIANRFEMNYFRS